MGRSASAPRVNSPSSADTPPVPDTDLVIGTLLIGGLHFLLVRERGSGTRATIERLFKDAGLPLRIGSEMSSNEAIKQMCAAGFGVAFLSMHACVLELQAGLLVQVPLPGQPASVIGRGASLAGSTTTCSATSRKRRRSRRGRSS